jgi:hypothetical protein
VIDLYLQKARLISGGVDGGVGLLVGIVGTLLVSKLLRRRSP